MAFTKQEKVMFDQVLEGFEDGLVAAKVAKKYSMGSPKEQMRSQDRVWRPQAYIASARDGVDQTGNFTELEQLSVPVQVDQHKSVPKTINSYDLRDDDQMRLFGDAAKDELATEINQAVQNRMAYWGSNFVRRTAAPTGFDDFAEAESALDEIGVPKSSRSALVATRDFNLMSGDITGRQNFTGEVKSAYNRALVPGGTIANFSVLKNDTALRLTAAAGGTVTVAGANQRHVPAARVNVGGEEVNLDNRTQSLTVNSTANVKAGDAFTLAGVNSVHLRTKNDTGQRKTFRVISVTNGTTLVIAPAIVAVDAGTPTQAEIEYQNVSATPANGAALTWLNTTDGYLNAFVHEPALEIIPGSFAVDDAGMDVMRAVSPLLGIAVTYSRQSAIDNLTCKARWDVRFGTALTNPEFGGAMMFNQA